jgi:putative oxidoreductase
VAGDGHWIDYSKIAELGRIQAFRAIQKIAIIHISDVVRATADKSVSPIKGKRFNNSRGASKANGNSPVIFNKTDSLAVGSADIIILIARILLGWLFLKAGWDKLMNPAGFTSYLAALGLPAFFTWPGLIAELVIGVGLILGVATRYAALFSAVYLVITIWCAHRYWTYPPPQQGAQFAHFLKNLALIGGSLAIFVTGAGRFSVDGKMK